MQHLVAGIHHFQNALFRPQQELFKRLAQGQDPDVLFITCSDSRVNPHLFTHSQPGDLFILRNAGNLVPPHGASSGGEGATIEFAVAGLEVRDIIVCGHSDCGAMKALLNPEKFSRFPLLSRWLEHAAATRAVVQEKYPNLAGQERLDAAVEENVLMQIENLRTHPSVAARLALGTVKLHGWVFEIATGMVFTFEPELQQFVPLVFGSSPGESISLPSSQGRRSI